MACDQGSSCEITSDFWLVDDTLEILLKNANVSMQSETNKCILLSTLLMLKQFSTRINKIIRWKVGCMKFPKDYTILIFLHALYDALFMKSLSTAVYATL